MEWGKMFVFALLLAGICFSAVPQAAAMEKAYGMQVCKIDYHRDLVNLAANYVNYIPESDRTNPRNVRWYDQKLIQMDSYLVQGTGFFDQDLSLLESTKGTNSLYTSIKNSNAHLRSAVTLYSQLTAKYARYGGRAARMQIASDRTEPMADYRQCILCVRNPNDASCNHVGYGTCSIKEGSETVSLRVDVQGYTPGEYQFSTAVGDTSYSIGGDEFPHLQDVTIENNRLFRHYVERQSFSASGTTSYDGSLSGVLANAEYSALLDADKTHGLPLCPGDEPAPLDNCNSADKLVSSRVFIKLLGQEWMISGIDGVSGGVPSTVADGEAYSIDGAKVTLAKEAVYGIINEGESLPATNGYKIRLDSISQDTNSENAHSAIITVLDANGDTICQDQVYPGETDRNLCGTGVILHVYQAAPGLVPIARWAEMSIYSKEIELVSGESFEGNGWNAQIYWTSEGGASDGDSPEYLRQISLVNPGAIALGNGAIFPIPSLDGSDAYTLNFYGEEGNSQDAFWIFSIPESSIEGMRQYTMHEGEMATIGTTGVTVKVLSIDEILNPANPTCTLKAGSETVTLQVEAQDGMYVHEYVLHENEEAQVQYLGVTVQVGEIGEEVETTP